MNKPILLNVCMIILQTVILQSQEAQLGHVLFISQRRDRHRLSQARSGVQMQPRGHNIKTGNIQRDGTNIHQRGSAFSQSNQDDVFHQRNSRSSRLEINTKRNEQRKENLIISSPQRQTEVRDIFFREDDDKTENGDNRGYWTRAQTGFIDLLCELCRREGRSNCVNIYCGL